MADRRGDESNPDNDSTQGKRPLSQRVSAAVSAAGSSGASRAGSSSPGTAEDRPARETGTQSSAKPSGSSGSQPAKGGTGGSTGAKGATAASASRPTSGRPSSRPRTRRARLRLVHLDPWSVMKVSFLLSIAVGIVTVVSVAVVWSVLGAAGVWDSINSTVTDVLGGETATGFDIENYLGTSRVLGFTMIVAVVDVVLITAIATLGAFLYNLAAALLGGLEVTLAEDDR
jgi:hypothetical protein